MVAAAVTGGVGALNAGASIFGSTNAAKAQQTAAQNAINFQKYMYDTNRAQLSPYMGAGASANAMLQGMLPSLTQPITMDQATLEKTPGYQFNLSQGLKSVQNSAAGRGLGVSGAAMKGAASYATGLADNTYQNQFNNAQTNRMTAYNMLSGQQSLGENAAAGLGNNGIATGQGVANSMIGAGNAQAAQYNSIGGALGNLGNSAMQGYLLQNMLGGGSNYFGGVNYNGYTPGYSGADTASAARAGVESGMTFNPFDGSVG